MPRTTNVPRHFLSGSIEHPAWEFDGIKFGLMVHPDEAREVCPFCVALDALESRNDG